MPILQNQGAQATCAMTNRVNLGNACGSQGNAYACGPNWDGDLAACQALCTKTTGCNYITYFSNKGCQLFTECPAWSLYQNGNSDGVIYQRLTQTQADEYAQQCKSISASTTPKGSFDKSSGGATGIYSASFPCNTGDVTANSEYVPVMKDKGSNSQCGTASRLPVGDACPGKGSAVTCGPGWGDLNSCQALCSKTTGCNYITYYENNGCQLFKTCEASSVNQNSDGISTIYEKIAPS